MRDAAAAGADAGRGLLASAISPNTASQDLTVSRYKALVASTSCRPDCSHTRSPYFTTPVYSGIYTSLYQISLETREKKKTNRVAAKRANRETVTRKSWSASLTAVIPSSLKAHSLALSRGARVPVSSQRERERETLPVQKSVLCSYILHNRASSRTHAGERRPRPRGRRGSSYTEAKKLLEGRTGS